MSSISRTPRPTASTTAFTQGRSPPRANAGTSPIPTINPSPSPANDGSRTTSRELTAAESTSPLRAWRSTAPCAARPLTDRVSELSELTSAPSASPSSHRTRVTLRSPPSRRHLRPSPSARRAILQSPRLSPSMAAAIPPPSRPSASAGSSSRPTCSARPALGTSSSRIPTAM